VGAKVSRKSALITGITGQDGAYLAELLLAKDYEVHGLIRRSSSFNTGRLEGIYQDPHVSGRSLFLHYGDLSDGSSLTNLIRDISPREVYNLAAQSHVKVSFEMPDYTSDVTAVGAVRVLEALRASGVDARFYQASSSEMYGSTPPPQSETTPFHPRSPYAVSKVFAFGMTVNYREAYDLFAANGILFNHESPRRGETFVTRKITMAVARIAAGLQEKLYLGNLDAVRDWGYAKEYVEAMWLMLQQPTATDYVVATGVGATVRDFCDAAFSRVGLDWTEYVQVDNKYLRPSEVDALIGDASKAEQALGWKAKTHWKPLAELMVDADVKLLNNQLSRRSVREGLSH
jgi:GDPmannose 4,6-dehydratase